MAQITAHQKDETAVINIPVSVVFKRANPCTWSGGGSDKKRGEKNGKQRLPRLYEEEPPHPILAWKPGEPINIGPPRTQYIDPWEVRRAFLAMSTEKQIIDFLNQTGRFAFDSGPTGLWGFDDMREWQNIIKHLLKQHSSNWHESLPGRVADQRKLLLLNIATRLPINFLWEGKHPRGVITTTTTLSAILATVFLDRLRGAKIKFCARPDCKKEFRVVSTHKRYYCTPYCAHLESLRRLRAQRKTKATTKNRKIRIAR